MEFHRDQRMTPHGAKTRPPRSGRLERTAEPRRLLARSFSYATARRSLLAVRSRRSRPWSGAEASSLVPAFRSKDRLGPPALDAAATTPDIVAKAIASFRGPTE